MRLLLCLSFTLALTGREASAQSGTQPIVARLVFAGSHGLDTALLRRTVSTRAGAPLDTGLLQRDVRALWALGGVRNIEVTTSKTARGRVVVRFEITAAPVLRRVRIVGAERIGDAVARRTVAMPLAKRVVPVDVKKAALRLQNQLVWQGYPDCRVMTETRPVPDGVELVFRVLPGKPVSVRSVRIVGNRSVSTRALIDAMDTRNGTVNARAGILVRSQLEADTRRMLAVYFRRGFVTAMVYPPAIRRSPDGAHADIVIRVREGKSYRMGHLSFSGRLHGSAVLHRGMVPIREGQRFDAIRVRRALTALRRYYRRAGYPGADLEVLSDIDREHGVVALEIRVRR